MKIFLAFFLFFGVVVYSSCKKLGWQKNKDSATCYCVYYSAPGLETRVEYKFAANTNQNYLSIMCGNYEQALSDKYGVGSNAQCGIQ